MNTYNFQNLAKISQYKLFSKSLTILGVQCVTLLLKLVGILISEPLLKLKKINQKKTKIRNSPSKINLVSIKDLKASRIHLALQLKEHIQIMKTDGQLKRKNLICITLRNLLQTKAKKKKSNMIVF